MRDQIRSQGRRPKRIRFVNRGSAGGTIVAMTTSSRGTPTAANDSRSGSVKGSCMVSRLSDRPRQRRPRRVVSQRWAVCWASVLALAAICLVGAPPASAALVCRTGGATGSVVGQPTSRVAWRAGLLGPTGVYGAVSRPGTRPRIFVGPAQASWLLVLDAARTHTGRCWVEVRLPWRPNDASGWVDAAQVILRPTRGGS